MKKAIAALLALMLISAPAYAQSPVPEGQDTFETYTQTVTDCAAAFGGTSQDAVLNCQIKLDKIIPQSCYAVHWATYRTIVQLAIEVVQNDNAVLEPALIFLINDWKTQAPAIQEACGKYTVPDEVS